MDFNKRALLADMEYDLSIYLMKEPKYYPEDKSLKSNDVSTVWTPREFPMPIFLKRYNDFKIQVP